MPKRNAVWSLPPPKRFRIAFPSTAFPYSAAEIPAAAAAALPPPLPGYVTTHLEEETAWLLRIPYNIMYSIIAFMSPQSVLALARTCKTLRFDLTHNTKDRTSDAYYFWAAAERAVGMPRCPSMLTGPEYAALVYDSGCMVCGGEDAKLDVRLMTRLCLACLGTRCTTGAKLIRPVVEDPDLCGLAYLDLHILLTAEITGTYIRRANVDYLTILDNLERLYYLPKITPVLEKYVELENNWLYSAERRFIDDRKQAYKDVYDFEQKLKCWWRVERREFKKKIKNKLLIRGHDRENLTSNMDSPELAESWMELLNKIGDLTADAEAELLVKLEEIVVIRKEAWRIRRIERRKIILEEFGRDIWRGIWNSLGHYPCLFIEDFLEPSVSQRIVEDDSLKETIPNTLIKEVRDAIVDIHCGRWLPIQENLMDKVLRARSEVSTYLKRDGPYVDVNRSSLRFSTTLFKHRNEDYHEGWELRTYEELLSVMHSDIVSGSGQECKDFVWDESKYEVSARAVRVAESVLAALEWDLAGLEVYQVRGKMFACDTCDGDVGMCWSELIEHCIREDVHGVGKVPLDDIPRVWQSKVSVLEHEEEAVEFDDAENE